MQYTSPTKPILKPALPIFTREYGTLFVSNTQPGKLNHFQLHFQHFGTVQKILTVRKVTQEVSSNSQIFICFDVLS